MKVQRLKLSVSDIYASAVVSTSSSDAGEVVNDTQSCQHTFHAYSVICHTTIVIYHMRKDYKYEAL